MMTKKEVLAAIEAHLKQKFGDKFTPELFTKAKAKAAIWQRNAYGHTDWVEHFGESGVECIDFYFSECLERPNDKDSSNRQHARQMRGMS